MTKKNKCTDTGVYNTDCDVRARIKSVTIINCKIKFSEEERKKK